MSTPVKTLNPYGCRCGDVRARDVQLQQVRGLHGDAAGVDRHPQGAQVRRWQPSAGK